MKTIAVIVLAVGVLCLIGGCVMDVVLGEDMSIECHVTGKYYVPEKTNISIDPQDGSVSVDTDPEEFHITVKEIYGDNSFDVKTSRSWYSTLTNSETIRVKAKLGKWTKMIHVGGLER